MSAIAAAAPARLDRRGLGVLSFGHLSVDLAQGTVPALLPFLVRDRGYSYAAAGALLLFSGIGSSFLQPLLGAFADRIRADSEARIVTQGLLGDKLIERRPPSR